MIGARRRCRNTDVELQKSLLFRVVRHGVGTDGVFLVDRLITPDIVLVPVFVELLLDVEILEADFVRGALQLHVTASAEVHFLAFRQLQYEFLDEGGHVVVRHHLALPLLHAKELFRYFDLHVLLYRNLARQAPAFFFFTVGEVGLFSGQHGAATFQNLTFTLSAGATATTGRRQENAVARQGVQQFSTCFRFHGVFRVVIDFNGDVAGADQF